MSNIIYTRCGNDFSFSFKYNFNLKMYVRKESWKKVNVCKRDVLIRVHCHIWRNEGSVYNYIHNTLGYILLYGCKHCLDCSWYTGLVRFFDFWIQQRRPLVNILVEFVWFQINNTNWCWWLVYAMEGRHVEYLHIKQIYSIICLWLSPLITRGGTWER